MFDPDEDLSSFKSINVTKSTSSLIDFSSSFSLSVDNRSILRGCFHPGGRSLGFTTAYAHNNMQSSPGCTRLPTLTFAPLRTPSKCSMTPRAMEFNTSSINSSVSFSSPSTLLSLKSHVEDSFTYTTLLSRFSREKSDGSCSTCLAMAHAALHSCREVSLRFVTRISSTERVFTRDVRRDCSSPSAFSFWPLLLLLMLFLFPPLLRARVLELSVSAHTRLAALHSFGGAFNRVFKTAFEVRTGLLPAVGPFAADWIFRCVRSEVS
mmetsp:Transcript_9634/g.20329  ORF Transcript_9634/g.20329 Transcript_9634/m.20329 type:complete len:265 (-) Transcript_9634:505-1299(-)